MVKRPKSACQQSGTQREYNVEVRGTGSTVGNVQKLRVCVCVCVLCGGGGLDGKWLQWAIPAESPESSRAMRDVCSPSHFSGRQILV